MKESRVTLEGPWTGMFVCDCIQFVYFDEEEELSLFSILMKQTSYALDYILHFIFYTYGILMGTQ